MDIDKIFDLIGEGYNCSQVVLMYFSDKLNLDVNIAKGIAKAFESGMFKGETCGVCSGAYIALGLKYHDVSRDEMHKIVDDFDSTFREKLNSNICEELLGINISSDENFKKAMSDGTIPNTCPNAIMTGIKILEEMI